MTKVYRSEKIVSGAVIEGPALVESPRATFLIEPGWELVMGEQNSAWIIDKTKKASRKARKQAIEVHN